MESADVSPERIFLLAGVRVIIMMIQDLLHLVNHRLFRINVATLMLDSFASFTIPCTAWEQGGNRTKVLVILTSCNRTITSKK
jgi:hypothetical protein